MDELYTMDRPRQMPFCQKFTVGLARVARLPQALWLAAVIELDARRLSQVAPFMLQLRSDACVQWGERQRQ
jgi:hypothetical protein